jgi:hypothetical protein
LSGIDLGFVISTSNYLGKDALPEIHFLLVLDWLMGFGRNGPQILIRKARLPDLLQFHRENPLFGTGLEMLISDWFARQTDRRTDKHFLFARAFLLEQGIYH